MTALTLAQQKSIRWAKIIGTVTHYIALLTIASMMVLPLVWMVSTALKPRKDVFAFPPQIIPKTVQLENFKDAWEAQPFERFMFNSFKVSILSILGQLLFCSMGGYGFARFDFPYKNQLFALLLAAMMIPTLVNIVPLFIMFKELGWLNNHITLIAPACRCQHIRHLPLSAIYDDDPARIGRRCKD